MASPTPIAVARTVSTRTVVTRMALIAAAVLTTGAAAFAQSSPPAVVAPAPAAPPVAATPDTSAPAVDATGKRRRGGQLSACRADMQTLCADVERGGGRKLQCLAENRDKASAECQAAMQAMLDGSGERSGKGRREGRGAGGKGAAQRLAACATDLATHCADVGGEGRPRGAARMQCLKQNTAKLTPDCAAAVQQLDDTRRQARQACAADAQAHCATAERGPALMQCLVSNVGKLSPACAAAVAELPAGRRGALAPAAGHGDVQAAPKPKQ